MLPCHSCSPVPAGEGQRSGRVAGTAGDFAATLVADVAVGVGHDEVVDRINPAVHGVGQLGNGAGVQHGAEEVRPRVAGVASGVAEGQGVAGQRVAADYRAVSGGPGADVNVLSVSHLDDFIAHVGVEP